MLGEIKSDRIKKLKDLVLSTPSAICTERAKIITETYRRNEDKPVVIKRALAVRDILEKMSIHILPGERIVGNHSSALRAAPIFPEYAVDWIVDELDEFEKRPGDRFLITEEQKKELLSIHGYWKGRTLIDHGLALFPPESLLAYHKGVIRAEGNLTSGDGHIAANFEKVLGMGLSGLKGHSGLRPTQTIPLPARRFDHSGSRAGFRRPVCQSRLVSRTRRKRRGAQKRTRANLRDLPPRSLASGPYLPRRPAVRLVHPAYHADREQRPFGFPGQARSVSVPLIPKRYAKRLPKAGRRNGTP
jgi:hypothetical protein